VRDEGLVESGWVLKVPRKRLGERLLVCAVAIRRGGDRLGESFALSLEEVVPCLGALELRFHYAQRLPGWEDGLPVLGHLGSATLSRCRAEGGGWARANVLLRRTLWRIVKGRVGGESKWGGEKMQDRIESSRGDV
jgi:hypothetical protein